MASPQVEALQAFHDYVAELLEVANASCDEPSMEPPIQERDVSAIIDRYEKIFNYDYSQKNFFEKALMETAVRDRFVPLVVRTRQEPSTPTATSDCRSRPNTQ